MLEKLVTLRYAYINHQREAAIEKELEKYLESINRKDIFVILDYIVKEFAANANKANLKRVYFDVNNLNINLNDDYELGIQKFRVEINKNYEAYFGLLEKRGYYVRIDFYVSKNFLIISAINNSHMLPVEKERFFEKLAVFSAFDTIEDVFELGLDLEESAGFGLILSVMMLKKLGLNEKFIKLIEDSKYTQMKLIIPLTLIKKQDEEFVADEIIRVVEDVPQIPQHIRDLQNALNDENSDFNTISAIIKNDPALTAGLLKTANSAFYMLPRKINSIEEAVRFIGLKGIRNLVLIYSMKNILMNRFQFDIFNSIISHSNEVAYYAYELAKKLNLSEIEEDVYLAGMLHDLGKLIVNSLKPDLIKKIKVFCRKKNINENIVENLTNGYSHSLVGAKLAKKWNFPENFVNTILYHHDPLKLQSSQNDLVSIVYLADFIYYYVRNETVFNSMNFNVLDKYKLFSKEKFDVLVESMKKDIEDKKIIFEVQ
jgi:putative nucleotidyltransferase with HDIG domain